MLRFTLIAATLAACSDSQEASTVDLPVTTTSSAFPAATTDLGYTVQLDAMTIAVTAIQFTIEGEAHPSARLAPHPGHSAGGEVTGELPGDFLFRWTGAATPVLGDGTLIVGDYFGANFAMRAATANDADAGPLVGHAIHLTGTVAKGGMTTPFDALFDVEPDTSIIGAVFGDTITQASTETLAFQFHPTDPEEGDTAFDGVDFDLLPRTAGAIAIRPGDPTHNIIRRALTTHDHYGVITQ